MSQALQQWGVFPEEAILQLKKREWDNWRQLKARLLDEKPFPIVVRLKPPKTGDQALQNLSHYHAFIDAWRQFAYPQAVQWRTLSFRKLGEQRIPVALQVDSLQQLAQLLGSKATARMATWERHIVGLLETMRQIKPELPEKGYYSVLIQNLHAIEKLSVNQLELIQKALPQLTAGMGQGQYLRALPLKGVDTKFVEEHFALLAPLLTAIYGNAIIQSGGIIRWLNCQLPPAGWLLVRPLCPNAQAALGNLPILQLSSQALQNVVLPASHILIVENRQSGLALPPMTDTIAVIGGGKNITWLADALWLRSKRVAYWGDIDTWGLSILGDARGYLENIQALMMDHETLVLHEERMVPEQEPTRVISANLLPAEKQLFQDLLDGQYQSTRLEQERLSSDYILQKLMEWLE